MPPDRPRKASRQRAAEAFRLRCRGRTLQEVADELGYGSPAAVHNAVQKHISRLPAEDRDMARAYSAGNYKQVIAELHEIGARAKAQNRLTTAVQAQEAIANVQAKHDHLIGIEAPAVTKVDVQVTSAVEAIASAREQLLAIAKARQPVVAIPPGGPVTEVIDAEVVEA